MEFFVLNVWKISVKLVVNSIKANKIYFIVKIVKN